LLIKSHSAIQVDEGVGIDPRRHSLPCTGTKIGHEKIVPINTFPPLLQWCSLFV